MRKWIAVIVVLGLVLIGLNLAEAISPLSKTYSIRNDTGAYVETEISTSIIIPGIHKVVGFTVLPTEATAAGAIASLYSGSGGRAGNQNLMGEAESLADTSKHRIFTYPKAVQSGGLIVYQSPYSDVSIDYVR